MKNKLLLALLVGFFLMGTTGIGNALTIVDIDALTNDTSDPVVFNFDAGTYDVTPIGGTYISWSAWSDLRGWVNKYGLSSAEFSAYNVWDGVRYDTQVEALDNALSTSFTLASAGAVNFFIDDDPMRDNTGGMTLQVTRASIPEPATMFLLGTGLIGLAGLRRRFKK